MPGRGKSVTPHTAIVFPFIASLTERSKSYNDIARLDTGIVDYICPFEPGRYGRIHYHSPYQIPYISGFPTRGMNGNSVFS